MGYYCYILGQIDRVLQTKYINLRISVARLNLRRPT